ncbi:hypothetical protein HRI_003363800 [Hibiscus trionum]|uniref:Uncharacterized protein n=1 Tax=Hibiscus trionum TaxID=183268 RepID=A0A9W7IIR2_HIBTR|nr:hypothetical protein HRI_003363800 [Hibiscus trionum]
MEPLGSQPPAPAELALSHDKHFALHGEIWLFIVVLIFALFFAYILLCPRFRCSRSSESEDISDSDNVSRRRTCLLVSSGSQCVIDIKDEVGDEEEEEDYASRINEKFPL